MTHDSRNTTQNMMVESTFHKQLKLKTHSFVMGVYDMTELFPKSELYGTVSQLRRASVSVMLNYIEGYARFRPKVKLNFFEIAFGSARECKYLLYLAMERERLPKDRYKYNFEKLDQVSRMLRTVISGVEKDINNQD